MMNMKAILKEYDKLSRSRMTPVTTSELEQILTAQEGWISVEDRLPEQHKKVLCFGYKPITTRGVKGSHPMWHIARYDGDKFPHPNRNGGILDYIAHWQPLPTPPKEGE